MRNVACLRCCSKLLRAMILRKRRLGVQKGVPICNGLQPSSDGLCSWFFESHLVDLLVATAGDYLFAQEKDTS